MSDFLDTAHFLSDVFSFRRPAWSTATLIPASFLCGIGAAILIWRGGERTKRVEEIRKKLCDALAEIPSSTNGTFSDPRRPQACPGHNSDHNSPIDRLELTEVINSSSEKLTNRDTAPSTTTEILT